jgi:ribosomal-protein-alanine N-acetyltransferase
MALDRGPRYQAAPFYRASLPLMFPESFSTARLTLRPIQAQDATAIFDSYGQDAEVTRYLTWRPHASIEETNSFVQMCLNAQNSQTYMIVTKATGVVAGVFDLRMAGKTRIEFGYALARPFWGQGLMTEALTEVARWALSQPSIWRVGAVADIENVGSIRVMEKAGLQREGVLRRWLVHPNTSNDPRDCVSFAATR